MKIRYLLKNARKDKDLTQSEVAKIIGKSTNHYQAIELGATQGSIDLWDKLEDLFGVPQRQLREVTPKKNNQKDCTTKRGSSK